MVNRNSSGFAISYYLSALYLFGNVYLFFVCFICFKNTPFSTVEM